MCLLLLPFQYSFCLNLTIPLFISVSLSRPAEAKQRGVMVRSCNIASLIPEPLPQSCQSPRYAQLPCLPTFPTPSQMREEYKCLRSLKPSQPSSSSSFSHIYTTLCLPPSIPDCSPPRTAKDILPRAIRVISADTTWQRSRRPPAGVTGAATLRLRLLNAYVGLCRHITSDVSHWTKPFIFVSLHL